MNHQHNHVHHQHKHPNHFVAGIGDGKHYEYDLPDPSSHSFIRKKQDILNLKKQQNHYNNHMKKKINRYEMDVGKGMAANIDGADEEDYSGSHHRSRHYKHEQQDEHQFDDPKQQQQQQQHNMNKNHIPNMKENTNLNNDPQLEYPLHHDNGILMHSSLITILGILSTLIIFSWVIKSDYVSELFHHYFNMYGKNHNHYHHYHHHDKHDKHDKIKGKHHHYSKKKQNQQQDYNSLLVVTSLFTKTFRNFQNKIRRVDSSIIRTEKKKTDEWNEDDDDIDNELYDEEGSSSTSATTTGTSRSERKGRRRSLSCSNNHELPTITSNTTSATTTNVNTATTSSYSHHHHTHNNHGFYRHNETSTRLRKYTAQNNLATTNNNITNTNTSNVAVAISTSTSTNHNNNIQQQSLFPSSSSTSEYSPERQPRKRFTIHHHDDDSIIDIGPSVGLEGFDIALSDSESIYTTTSDVVSTKSNTTSTLYSNRQYHGNTTAASTFQQNYRSRDVNSTSSVENYSDEEWDKVSKHERRIILQCNSSHSTTKGGYNNNLNNNVENQRTPPQRTNFCETSSPTKSTTDEHYYSDSSTCSDLSKRRDNRCGPNSSIRNDEEMPTPRIDNIPKKLSSMDVHHNHHNHPLHQPKPHGFLPTSTSYSLYTAPDIPGLPCLSLESNPTQEDEEDGNENDAVVKGKETQLQVVHDSDELHMTRSGTQIKTSSPPSKQIESNVNVNNKNHCNNNNLVKSPAPRSISVEELKLIRMETGIVGTAKTKWQTTIDPQDAYHKNASFLSSPPVCVSISNKVDTPNGKTDYRMVEEGTIIMDKYDNKQGTDDHCNVEKDDEHYDEDDDEHDMSSGETEGANGILHKRKDLTSCSDAASSLTSPISFSELKVKDLIGGGGFGQVWSATWRGTPVAVKVLAVSHKAENIQRAILQEFAAEINMVSGMRHPNICLYIGACLEPSNRAIVTELAANGSLWDALRLPLNPPYVVADGKTRNTWPLSVYQSHSVGTNEQISTVPEFSAPVPFGTSPYIPLAPEGSW